MQIIDPRDRKLAQMLISHSTRVIPGDMVYVECIGADTLGLGRAVIDAAVAAGAAPHLQYSEPVITRSIIEKGTDDVFERMARFQLKMMKDATVYIGIRGSANSFEMNGVDPVRMKSYTKLVSTPVHMEERVKRTRWCIMRYPNPGMAQMAGKCTEDFARFYYDVCCLDYPAMAKACEPLTQLMSETKSVRIKGPGLTDVSFSIEGIPAVACAGNMNIPDGECFTAPVRDSLNGCVQFNAPTMHEGQGYENITVWFEHGKAVQVQAANDNQTVKLNEILDRDEGSRYVGEFAVGFNPFVLDPMRDILFDEKISGSFHMALGQCYDETPNGNVSSLHWDLVCIQRPEYGGGEMWFDDVPVRKDGLFVLESLVGLNPDKYRRTTSEQ